jgi:hypothetical protein
MASDMVRCNYCTGHGHYKKIHHEGHEAHEEIKAFPFRALRVLRGDY